MTKKEAKLNRLGIDLAQAQAQLDNLTRNSYLPAEVENLKLEIKSIEQQILFVLEETEDME